MVQIPEEGREPTPTVYLKDGTSVEVPLSELADYLEANRDNIQTRTKKRRGPVRSKLTAETNLIG
ncbi:hypothetical protein CAL7716_107080 (plasmid) [Calothrix sp. PCC 7716]|nr:hypothetical protein CAL7716_107080 [Calothrix sp. PCC 7716]